MITTEDRRSAEELSSWWRLVELCCPRHAQCGAATFRPRDAGTLEADWDGWLDGVFLPAVRPRLAGLHAAASRQDIRQLCAEEKLLSAALSADASAASLQAGRCNLLGLRAPQGAKLLERWGASAPESGHFAAVFVVRGQLFHLPLVQIAAALVLAELLLGSAAAGVTPENGRIAGFMHGAIGRMAAEPAPVLLAV